MEQHDEPWFRQRLERFLAERHPQRHIRHSNIAVRSRRAYELYANRIRDGGSETMACREADEVLFRGLLFSKYDTVNLILATDYPEFGRHQRHDLTLKLLRIFSQLFRQYRFGDDYAGRDEYREFRHLLRRRIRQWLQENSIKE